MRFRQDVFEDVFVSAAATRPGKRRDYANTEKRACDAPGCAAAGAYKAPKSRERLRDYYYFCLPHVREYNAKWNYFAGLSDEQVLSHIEKDAIGHRPTRRLSGEEKEAAAGRQNHPLYAVFFDPFDLGRGLFDEAPHSPVTERESEYEKEIRAACAVLQTDYPPVLEAVRKSYKVLVKKLHPDSGAGKSPEAAERFHQVVAAYKFLQSHLKEG